MPEKGFLQSSPSSLMQKFTMAFMTLKTLTMEELPRPLFTSHSLKVAASAVE